MLRLYWNQAILDLCKLLGPGNVFVSIVESGSQEDTKGALEELRMGLEAMGVENRIELGEGVEEQIWGIEHPPESVLNGTGDGDGDGGTEGWIRSGRGETGWERRRIRLVPFVFVGVGGGFFEVEVILTDGLFSALSDTRNKAMEPLTNYTSRRWDRVLWINDVVFTVSYTTLLV